MELLCGPPPVGADLDVGRSGHDGQALHPLSDPVCRLRLPAGLRHRDGPLHPEERGEVESQSRLEQTQHVCSAACHGAPGGVKAQLGGQGPALTGWPIFTRLTLPFCSSSWLIPLILPDFRTHPCWVSPRPPGVVQQARQSGST